MNKALKRIFLVIIILVILLLIFFPILKIDKFIMKKIYPKKYEYYIEHYAEEYNVDELLIFAIIKTESNFNEKAKSKSNAIGLMQLMENTAIELANKTQNYNANNSISENEIYDPINNIELGTYYFSTLLKQYGNIGIALAAYNAGMGRVNEWIEKGIIKSDGSDLENIPYQETNMYVRKVLNNYKIYQDLYSKL